MAKPAKGPLAFKCSNAGPESRSIQISRIVAHFKQVGSKDALSVEDRFAVDGVNHSD
jgi:hypothetical protein